MPQRIDVPGMGIVEFPDGMDDAQITAAIQQNMGAPQQPPQRGAMDKLTGATGERYQTWPEKLVRGIGGAVKSGVTLPHDVMQEAMQPAPDQISDSDVSTLSVPRTMDAALMGGGINPMARSGDRAIPGMAMSTEKRVVPTQEALHARGASQIEQARNLGVDVTGDGVKNLGLQIEGALQSEKGIHAELAPKTFAVLSKLREPPDGSVATFGNLQTLRRSLGHAASSPDATERHAASVAIERLDQWIKALPESTALAGPAAAENAGKAAELYSAGRGNFAASKRSEDVTGRSERADLRAAAANSGHNIGNATRQRFVDLAVNPKAGRGYTPEELAQAERIVRGGAVTNAARDVGNFFGGGGGLGQMLTAGAGAGVGAVVGGPVGAAVGAGAGAGVGASARALANALTKREVRKLDEQTRARSPMYQEMPLDVKYPTTQDALIRALLMQQNQRQ